MKNLPREDTNNLMVVTYIRENQHIKGSATKTDKHGLQSETEARRRRKQPGWEPGHGEQHVRSIPVTCFLFPGHLRPTPPPPPHRLRTAACERRVCVLLSVIPLHLRSCDLSRAVTHSVKTPAINSRTALGFPCRH